MSNRPLIIRLELTGEQVERLAHRVAEIVAAQTQPSPPSPPFLSVREASDLLRSSRQRVYDLLSDGRLTRHKDGTRVLIRRDEIERYLAGTHSGPLQRRTGR